jgi:hypothetical protein
MEAKRDKLGQWAKGNQSAWKGGRITDKDGYILVYSPDHPHKNGIGYVREHRLIVEQSIGRYLLPSEHVHHKDEDKTNNDISNLEVSTNSEHTKKHNVSKARNKVGQYTHENN